MRCRSCHCLNFTSKSLNPRFVLEQCKQIIGNLSLRFLPIDHCRSVDRVLRNLLSATSTSAAAARDVVLVIIYTSPGNLGIQDLFRSNAKQIIENLSFRQERILPIDQRRSFDRVV
mmetsp:Transcript_18262/g.36917  ORF Transcript_18262/g.36917 Transcript_18262/m.36917 type:complete len:116 (-) Transcript_18262:49-396(-)